MVRGASRLAASFGVNPLLVGLTVVAFGTSAPEVAVSVQAATSAQGGVALGNVVGSNIFNVLLILGLSAVVAPLVVQRQLVRLDVPVLIAVSTLPILLGLDRLLSRRDGLLLLVLGATYTGTLAFLAFRARNTPEPGDATPGSGSARHGNAGPGAGPGQTAETADGSPSPPTQEPDPPAEPHPPTRRGSAEEPHPPAGHAAPGETAPPMEATSPGRGPRGRLMDLLMVAAGLVGLVLGARWLVDAATALARTLGMSDLVIGLTIVAAGTSLPEMATSVVASFRGERDLAVGNVVGSNIFNILIVLGAASAAAPGGLFVPTGALTFDFPVMVALAVACLPIFFTGSIISRWEGAVFLAYYMIYLTYLFLDASTHDGKALFGSVVLLFVVPMTVLLAAAAWWRSARHRDAVRG